MSDDPAPLPCIEELCCALVEYDSRPTPAQEDAVKHAARWVASELAALGWTNEQIFATVAAMAEHCGVSPADAVVALAITEAKRELRDRATPRNPAGSSDD